MTEKELTKDDIEALIRVISIAEGALESVEFDEAGICEKYDKIVDKLENNQILENQEKAKLCKILQTEVRDLKYRICDLLDNENTLNGQTREWVIKYTKLREAIKYIINRYTVIGFSGKPEPMSKVIDELQKILGEEKK